MYVCKIYLTSVKNVKNVIISNIYNINLNRPRRISFATFYFNKYYYEIALAVLETRSANDINLI